MSWWRTAFEKVEPGQKPTKAPDELQTWTTQTVYGLVCGSVYGGYRGLQIAKTSTPSPVPTTSARHRASVFFVQESILTGARIGLFVATFSAAALAIEHWRAKDDPANYAISGGITCGLFGGAVGGWYGVLPSAAFGTVVGGVGAVARASLKPILDGIEKEKNSEAHVELEIKESINKLIDRYETGLQKYPKLMRTADEESVKRENSSDALDNDRPQQ